MGSLVSLSHNPSIRDQAIKNGYFAKISVQDLKNPLFSDYDIKFTEIQPTTVIFEGLLTDYVPYTCEDFGLTVCEISFSGRCRLVPVPGKGHENMYDLIDASYVEPKKLIRVWVHEDKDTKFALKYYIH